MDLLAMLALARKDLKIFFSDRRSMIMSLVVPVALASFMAMIFAGNGGSEKKINAVDVLLVDQDDSDLSKAVVASMEANGMVAFKPTTEEEATKLVRTGKAGSALVIPAGFGKQAPDAMFGGQTLPEIQLLHDPSKGTEAQIVEGALMQSAMQEVSQRAFSPDRINLTENIARIDASTQMSLPEKVAIKNLLGSVEQFQKTRAATTRAGGDVASGSGSGMGMRTPFNVTKTALAAPAAGTDFSNAGAVHAFIGMAMQGMLFFAVEAGMSVLKDRDRGVWKRMRAAPLSKLTLLTGRTVSAVAVELMILTCVLTAGAIFFHVRVTGSGIGFVAVCLATAVMTATLGLVIATLGKNEQQSRGMAIFAVLMLTMLGGAWVPSFLMPKFMQIGSKVVPSGWAVSSLDAMTWRGGGLNEAIVPTLVLIGFSIAFATVAVLRFSWEEA